MPALFQRPALAALLACLLATGPAPAADSHAPRLLIFGEMHDQPDQQRQVAAEVASLAAAGRLAAVVLEMADAPHGTSGLPRDASESQVREALAWRGWPWSTYAEVVMNAVRAGVPVWGGNLPRGEIRTAMADTSLDGLVDAEVREALTQAVRTGHCNLLPKAQEPGMVRIQIARDASMARVLQTALRTASPGTQVLLLTGAQHAARDQGVPLHVMRDQALSAADIHVVAFGDGAPGTQVDERRRAEFKPQPDHCEGLRQTLSAASAASAASAVRR